MGLFDKLTKKFANTTTVYTPVHGEVISLKDIADGIFSEGILGKGVGIRPADGVVYAPFDGKVVQIADTKHAICIENHAGVQLMIHVGLDTVNMEGNGFEQQVKVGDTVTGGQQLMTFSIEEIQKAGYPTTAVVVILNSNDYSSIEILGEGQMTKADKLIQIS